MSILIKGMEMPIEGTVIAIYKLNNKFYASVHGTELCPLIEVPPHGRLIDAEPIMKFITDGLNSGEFGYDQIKVLTEIQYAPTIIPSEEGE